MRLACFVFLLLGCHDASEARCPRGAAMDAAESRALRALLPASDQPRRGLCVDPETELGVVVDDGPLLLNSALGTREQAARVAHLAMHQREPPYVRAPGETCEAVVERALRREARAWGRELELRRTLGVRDPVVTYPLEAEFRAQPASERVSLLYDFLVAHPNGGPGVDALGASYAQRCARE